MARNAFARWLGSVLAVAGCLTSPALGRDSLDGPPALSPLPVIFASQSLPCGAYGSPFQNLCAATIPSAWTEGEKSVVRSLMSEFASNPSLRPVVAEFTRGEYRFFKFQRGLETSDGRRFRPAFRAMGWVAELPARSVALNQRFFDVSYRADPRRGFDLRALMLLHEIFHAVDRLNPRTFSGSTSFRAAARQTLFGIDLRECIAIRDRYVAEANRGREEKAWRDMRAEVAMLRNVTGPGNRYLPSATVCLASAAEAFADYAAYWHLDPRARSYFPGVIKSWLQATFPSTR